MQDFRLPEIKDKTETGYITKSVCAERATLHVGVPGAGHFRIFSDLLVKADTN